MTTFSKLYLLRCIFWFLAPFLLINCNLKLSCIIKSISCHLTHTLQVDNISVQIVMKCITLNLSYSSTCVLLNDLIRNK